jgi:hypothetical protein
MISRGVGMRTNNTRRVSGWLVFALFILLFSGSVALGQDWPSCSSSGCVSSDLQVLQVFVEAQSCIGSSRSGVLKAELSTNTTRYAVRLAGKVYAIGAGGATRLITTVEVCLTTFTGTSSVTLDASLAWNCDERLELRDVLVSWQSNSSFYPCGTSLPCSAITPKCNYYGSAFAVAGSEPANQRPSAADNTVSTDEDTAHVFTLSEFGYSDPDGDALDHVKITRLETRGELKVSGVGVSLNQQIAASSIGAGQLTFTPFPDDYATAYTSFDFKVHDGTEYSSTSYTMTIDVDPVNDPPVAQNQARSVIVLGSTGPFALAISDPDDLLADLSCSCIDPPDYGTVVIVDPVVHTVNYENTGGAPTTDTFTYRVCDPDSACDTAIVTITVEAAPNSNPVVGAADQSTPEDTPITFQVSHGDADGDTLTCTASPPTQGTISPDNWTISSPYPAYKDLTYTPHTDFVGVDTLVISCTDGNGGMDVVSVQITVTTTNDAPVAVDGSTTLLEDVPVTAQLSGYDPDGDPLTFAITAPPSHGTTSGFDSTSGAFTFTPDADYHGTDTMTFEVCDPSSACDTGTFTFTVSSINDVPIAVDDSIDVARDASAQIAVLANDSDADGDPLHIAAVMPPLHGTAEIVGNQVKYVPSIGYYGSDTLTYLIEDSHGGATSAEIHINVLNAPPRADAGGVYLGLVGEPILLDARFSTDPNIEDTLQYRWDTNGDGKWDTEWLRTATVEYVYERPHRGPIAVEVRDLYLGSPIGATDTASTFALIEPKPTQIAVSVYVDLNGNGEFDEEDAGLPGVSLLFDDALELLTEEDGTAILDDVAPGIHTIRISEEGIAYLQERGFFLEEEALASVELVAGEWIALFFNPEARGFLEVDLGAEDDRNSEGND